MINNTSPKAVMTLFTSPTCASSHCVRLVLHEKGVAAEIEFFDPEEPTQDVLEINPTGASPTFVERDLVLYDARIIMEYLDERFPYPPLHQVDLVSRTNSRMIMKRIDEHWYQLLHQMQNSGEKKSARAKKMLKESLISANPVFESQPYFMSDSYSLIDCTMAPLLWRLPSLGINMKNLGPAISAYAERLFAREAFVKSLSADEEDMAL